PAGSGSRPLSAAATPVLRASAPRGSGASPALRPFGLWAPACRSKTEPSVPHAIVIALSHRHEPARMRVLTLAADLDAERSVRDSARLALGGSPLPVFGRGPNSAWLGLRENPASGAYGAPSGCVILSSELGLPAVSDADGSLLLLGLPSGEFRLRLAAARGKDEP